MTPCNISEISEKLKVTAAFISSEHNSHYNCPCIFTAELVFTYEIEGSVLLLKVSKVL
jgi:hypothetical protein